MIMAGPRPRRDDTSVGACGAPGVVAVVPGENHPPQSLPDAVGHMVDIREEANNEATFSLDELRDKHPSGCFSFRLPA